MAEEVSVSKFEYNDEDLDEVTETDDEQEGNQNNFNDENLVKTPEDPNVRTAHLSLAPYLTSNLRFSSMKRRLCWLAVWARSN